jgi:hypothetical protein
MSTSPTVFHAFQNSLGYSRFTSAKGKDFHFLNGEFLTNIQAEIDELNAEVAAGHPHIYVNPDRVTVDTKYVDPLAELKAKAIEEYLANQAAALDKTNDRGSSIFSGKLEGIANSTTVSDGMAGSNSGDIPVAPAPTASVLPTAPAATKIVAGPKAK